MGGGGTETVTQTSGLNNKQLNQAVSTIGSQLNTQLGKGVKGYEGSLVPELSGQTQAGIQGLSSNPNNAAYGAGISGAISNQADIAAGNFGNDPVRKRVLDDALTGVNTSFLTDGRFGSSAMVDEASDAAVGSLANFDYGRQQQAIQNLPGLYQASNMPAAANLQAGNLMDAYKTAQANEAARLFDVQNNSGWATLERAGGILGTTSGSAGTVTSETSPTTPWWQSALGFVAGNVGNAMRGGY